MRQFYVEIVTPHGRAFEGTAEKLVVPTDAGPVCIMAGHIDYFAKLTQGRARLTADGKERSALCRGGVMLVRGGRVTVAAVKFEWE